MFNSEKELELYYQSLNPIVSSKDANGNPIQVRQYPESSMVWIRLDNKGRPMLDNGVTLEVQVPGYRTEKVEGRDSMSSDISELSYPHKDGSKYQSKKLQSRDITVYYTLLSTTPEIHRQKLRKIRSILFGSDSEYSAVMFRDESDVFYLGSVREFTEAKFVRNFASNGTIVIHCSDPFKYSVKVFEQKAEKDSNGKLIFDVDYKGTYPSSPSFIATHKAENGYIAYTDEKSHIIQVGDPDEQDQEKIKKEALTLVDENFGTSSTLSDHGWYNNVFTIPTDSGATPIYTQGKFMRWTNAFSRANNSKMPDDTGLWLKETDITSTPTWHGPNIFKGFYDGSGNPLYLTEDPGPVKMFNAKMNYVFAKQSNGRENMQSGYEMVIFGVDTANPKTYNWKSTTKTTEIRKKNGTKVNPAITTFSTATIDGTTYDTYPYIRVYFYNKSATNTSCNMVVRVGDKVKGTETFDCKMPLELKKADKAFTGWFKVADGHWRYYKKGTFLKGFHKLPDSYGTFWFYFDSNGYCLMNTWSHIKWSKGYDWFYFNDRGEMRTGGPYTMPGPDGVSGSYSFDDNGCCNELKENQSSKGWHGAGHMWRYYVEVSTGKYEYLTGWQKLKDQYGTFWFYFNSSGYALYGWQKLKWNGKEGTYYFNGRAEMVTGTQKINGVTYKFDGYGVLVSGVAPVLTNSASTVSDNTKAGRTDPYYKMSISELTVQVYDKTLTVIFNGKTYTYKDCIPETVIFTGIGIQQYNYWKCTDLSYTQAKINNGEPIGVQYVDMLKVVQLKSDWKDISNTFSKGAKNSVVTVDCNTGDIYLHDQKSPGLGALGNDYETLKLVPSTKSQKIECAYSKWAEEAPEFTIQYREVFL